MDTVRRAVGVKRVGHTGTLDPFASGLLVMLIGKATRLAQFLAAARKTYFGVMRLGIETDSWDRTGTVERDSGDWKRLADQSIEDVLTGLIGTQSQQPPPLSAKKLRGVPAHRRVRRGERVELAPSMVEVDAVDMLNRDGPLVSFRTTVGSGTYIRWLAHEAGRRLGCGAHLEELRRERVGTFRVEDAVSPEHVSADRLLPPAVAVSHLPAVVVGSDDVEALHHGRFIERPVSLPDGSVALLNEDRLVAVATASGDRLRPQVVLV